MGLSSEVEIRTRIAGRGQITFAEFMDVALYHPVDGYYARGPAIGAHGDYYTSPGAHPSFGALISVQLHKMWESLDRPVPFYAIEMGSGSGLLARDIVEYALTAFGPFGRALRYVAIDRAPPGPLPSDGPPTYQRIAGGVTPLRGVIGCFLSNELVDSFPVHRFQVVSRSAKEVFVTLQNERLTEVLGEPSTPLIQRRLEGCVSLLPDGYRGEVNLRIRPWMTTVAESLERGFVLTIDYGYAGGEMYSPDRAGGTIQTYFRHTGGTDPYRRIGMQDITAHVDFSAVMREGEGAGLNPVGLCSQAQFLNGLGLQEWVHRGRTESSGSRERSANMMAMRELVSPDGLGRFKVLVQQKGTQVRDLGQITPVAADEVLPVPRLRPEHVPLMEGRYPHTAWQLDELWPQSEAPLGARSPEVMDSSPTGPPKV